MIALATASNTPGTWFVISVVGSIVTAVGTLIWAVIRDRRSNTVERRANDADFIGKALTGMDSLVEDLQRERKMLSVQVSEMHMTYTKAIEREQRLIVELSLMKTEVQQLRLAVEVLRRTLQTHGIPIPPIDFP